jgi:hypothetical protein
MALSTPATLALILHCCCNSADLVNDLQLIYRLDSGEWSTHGNPLFFILVEAGESISIVSVSD